MNLEELALKIAESAFCERYDKAGVPYIKHLSRVASHFKNGQYICAILHDLLEDCPQWTEGALRNIFSSGVVDVIVCLTKVKNESYDDYIERVSKERWAREIKVKDLLDNMDITRLTEITDKDIERVKKYHNSWLKLTK
jgi:(p)ppGpp synthase/HD superfamily hydrolase